MRLNRLVAAAIPAVLIACSAGRPIDRTGEPRAAARVQAPGLLFEVLYTPRDVSEVGRVSSGLLSAGPRLARWGAFREGVRIFIYADHAALEADAQRKGYPWLRAWATADSILLQSPRTWETASETVLAQELDELLVHELTHSLMYQLMQEGPGLDATIEEPPLWFREGMASVTADQGHRRLSGDELARFLAAHPGVNLLNPSPELYRTEKEAVYGAAHRAFDLLVRVAGDQAVRDIFRGVREGARFSDAFKAATGQRLADFEREAIRSGFNPTVARFQQQRSGAGGP